MEADWLHWSKLERDFASHAFVVKALESVSQEYLECYLNTIDLKQYITGSAQPKLTQKNLSGIPVSTAPSGERSRIVSAIKLLQERSSRAESCCQKSDCCSVSFARVCYAVPSAVEETNDMQMWRHHSPTKLESTPLRVLVPK